MPDSLTVSDQVPDNLADLVREAAARRPDVAALIVGDRRLTWSDVDGQVDLAAAGLIESGLTQGDRLALLLGNSAEFVVAYFAALRAGLVAVPLNPGFTPPEIARLLDHSGARVVVADQASLGALRATDTEIQVVVTGGSVAGETRFDELVESGHGRSPVTSHMTAEQLAVILYTSGTSGDPKGAMLTHRALRASVEQVAASTPIVGTDDVVLMVLPLSHIYSLNGTLGAVVRQAATMVVQNGFAPDEALQLVRDQGVTNIAGAPAMWAAWSTR
ncbi:MAG: AMP-binding protein, partial [Candidatus Nanopelagicales bacterium]